MTKDVANRKLMKFFFGNVVGGSEGRKEVKKFSYRIISK